MAPSSIRIATLPQSVLADLTPPKTGEWLAAATPDVVIPLGGAGAEARRVLAREADRSIPVITPGGPGPDAEERRVDGGRVHVARGESGLRDAVEALAESDSARRGADGVETAGPLPPVILTDAIALEVETTSLSTTVHGREALEPRSGAAGTPAGTGEAAAPVVLSTGLPAGYRNRIAGRLVLGVGETDDPATTALAVTEIYAGRTLQHTIDPDRLGLEAVRGVGPSRAGTLATAGFDTREAVAEASLAALADLDGLGSEVAATVQASARAIAEGEVVRETRTPLPASEPLFVDIETDGLHPTVTWLVGVLDGNAADGTYRSFLARDPEDPGAAIEEFVDWYRREEGGRTLVAYNGRQFDFPVLRDHLQAYRPALAPVLEAADTFDPYAWAVTEGNASLPGRTNRLEDVAAGLGFEGLSPESHPREPPLTGAAVARAYRRWLGDPGDDTEPPWSAVDAYCEADVRALARVYEALDSGATDDEGPTETPTPTTTQGTLSEW